MREYTQEELEAHCGKLWDTQWTNVVNHDNCYRGWGLDDAVNHAVKMTEEYMRANFASYATALRQQGEPTVAAWREEWAGSDPGRGWYIREATGINGRVVAYLGDVVTSEQVREVIAAHNASLYIGKPPGCADRCPPEQVCDYCQAVAPLLQSNGQRDSEPVLYRYRLPGCPWVYVDAVDASITAANDFEVEPLYTHAERATVAEIEHKALEKLVTAAVLMLAEIDTCGHEVDPAYRLALYEAWEEGKSALAAAPSQPKDAQS